MSEPDYVPARESAESQVDRDATAPTARTRSGAAQSSRNCGRSPGELTEGVQLSRKSAKVEHGFLLPRLRGVCFRRTQPSSWGGSIAVASCGD